MAMITDGGTRGLSSNWFCVYRYNDPPAVPQFETKETPEHGLIVRWSPLLCTDKNTARVLYYRLLWMDLMSGF